MKRPLLASRSLGLLLLLGLATSARAELPSSTYLTLRCKDLLETLLGGRSRRPVYKQDLTTLANQVLTDYVPEKLQEAEIDEIRAALAKKHDPIVVELVSGILTAHRNLGSVARSSSGKNIERSAAVLYRTLLVGSYFNRYGKTPPSSRFPHIASVANRRGLLLYGEDGAGRQFKSGIGQAVDDDLDLLFEPSKTAPPSLDLATTAKDLLEAGRDPSRAWEFKLGLRNIRIKLLRQYNLSSELDLIAIKKALPSVIAEDRTRSQVLALLSASGRHTSFAKKLAHLHRVVYKKAPLKELSNQYRAYTRPRK